MTVEKKDRYLVCKNVETSAELIDLCKEPEAPIIVVFPSQSFVISQEERKELMECRALLVIAALTINQFDFNSVMSFDLRISEEYYAADKIELSDEKLAKICGYHAVWEKEKEGCVKSFTTVLCGEEAFEERVEGFIVKLISDKPDYHLFALADCFRLARSGDYQAVLERESYHIVRLEQRNAGGTL